MAWTHFTALLNGTRPITKLERDDLYNQLAAKLACPPRYTLPSATMTPIKASLLITDRAAIFDSLLSGTSFGRLDSLITGVSGAFTNTATAKTAALALAGISSGNLGTILTALTDDYRLWNFLRSWIDLLIPIGPGEPTFVKRTASASKTKCGFEEFPGYESTPRKIYLRQTHSGSVSYAISRSTVDPDPDDSASGSQVSSGFFEYTDRTCGGTNDTVVRNRSDTDISGTVTISDNLHHDTVSIDGGQFGGCLVGSLCAINSPAATTATTQTWDFTVSDGRFSMSGSQVLTLSNEFTTAHLITDTLAAIPSFAGSYTAGAQTALNDLTSDEVTASLRSIQYKFTLPTLTGYTAYRIDWTEVFNPSVGAPTGTNRSYIWNLSDTETPAYTITAPSTEGSTAVVITAITAAC